MKRIRRILSAALTLVLLLALIPIYATAEWYTLPEVATATAVPTSSTVLVNGVPVEFDAYLINQNNYFKLRDIAYTLRDTEKRFDVEWEEPNEVRSNGLAFVYRKREYTVVGGEMEGKSPGNKSVTFTGLPTRYGRYGNGGEYMETCIVYAIEGNNYFKLRDIAKMANFYVGWDGEKNTVTIDTSEGYVTEALVLPPVPTEEEAYKRIIALKEYFPHGSSWGYSTSYVPVYGDTYEEPYDSQASAINGTSACVGFARLLSDAAFGALPIIDKGSLFAYGEGPKVYNSARNEWVDSGLRGEVLGYDVRPKVGDLLEYAGGLWGEGHVSIVLSVNDSSIVIAEGNADGKVNWDRRMDWADFGGGVTVYTRYPE